MDGMDPVSAARAWRVYEDGRHPVRPGPGLALPSDTRLLLEDGDTLFLPASHVESIDRLFHHACPHGYGRCERHIHVYRDGKVALCGEDGRFHAAYPGAMPYVAAERCPP